MNQSILKCKHINYMNFFHKIDSKGILVSNSEIQFMVAMLYCYNDNSLRIQYTPPANLGNIEILTLPTVQALTSIFKDVTVLTDGQGILQFYLTGLLPECEKAFTVLWNNNIIDKSIIDCFKGKNIINVVDPGSSPIIFELVDKNYSFDEMKICSHILSNHFLSFLFTQCIRNDMYLVVPLKGWNINEIDKCEYFNMLTRIFQNVWFCGYGDKWISDNIIVYQPYKHIIAQFSHLDRSGFSSNTLLNE
ncbi:hypothetical protein [Ruminiclostridium cellobioparum]|uniref:hypothetical protein n=1 Tax=Ruminiclostridium cellobioparum TaxID=29355 RepID=UPI00034C4B60|nr:hypothetical protein [Ruminiclostridium cellobioparum]